MDEKLVAALVAAYDAVSALRAAPDLFSDEKRDAALRRALDALKLAWKACGLTDEQLAAALRRLQDSGQGVRWEEDGA